MNNQMLQHSQAWVSFTYASFILSLLMIGGGITLMPIDLWIKGFLGMGIILLVQSCITLTKTARQSGRSEARQSHRGRQNRAAPHGCGEGSVTFTLHGASMGPWLNRVLDQLGEETRPIFAAHRRK